MKGGEQSWILKSFKLWDATHSKLLMTTPLLESRQGPFLIEEEAENSWNPLPNDNSFMPMRYEQRRILICGRKEAGHE